MMLAALDSYSTGIAGADAPARKLAPLATSEGQQTPIASHFTPTYLGQTVALPRNVSTLTAPQDSRAINTAVAQTEESRSGFISDIVNGAGKVLSAFGVEITASGNGVSVYRAPSPGGSVTLLGDQQGRISPLVYVGGALVIAYLVTRN